MPVIARSGRTCLRDYGGHGPPIVVVPSLINPPIVLDLSPDTSLLRWLAGQGHRPLLVDWGKPTPEDRHEDITEHVGHLLAMLRALGEQAVLVGYCLGGTIALGVASAIPVAGIALVAAPWHFTGFGEAARTDIAGLWSAAEPGCEALGLVPMEVLQSGFWRLDPARTIAKFETLATASDADLASFVALEDWANAGAPLTLAAGRQMFERFFAADDPGQGAWRISDAPVDPAALPCPIIDFVSTQDRIVPAATSVGIGDRREVAAGHVGIVVGSRARALLWEPLADWISALPPPR